MYPKLLQEHHARSNFAYGFLITGVLFQLISIVGLFVDASNKKKQLSDFEQGYSQTCPASTSTHTIMIFAILEGLGLVGLGIALAVMLTNPFHDK